MIPVRQIRGQSPRFKGNGKARQLEVSQWITSLRSERTDAETDSALGQNGRGVDENGTQYVDHLTPGAD